MRLTCYVRVPVAEAPTRGSAPLSPLQSVADVGIRLASASHDAPETDGESFAIPWRDRVQVFLGGDDQPIASGTLGQVIASLSHDYPERYELYVLYFPDRDKRPHRFFGADIRMLITEFKRTQVARDWESGQLLR